MGFFDKAEYQEFMLPLKFMTNEEEREAGNISIEAYGNVMGEYKYCFASYDLRDSSMYKNGAYEELIDILGAFQEKYIRVKFKIKNKQIKDFKIDIESIAEVFPA